MTDEPRPPILRLDRRDGVALAVILAWALLRLAPGLGHPYIHGWDESMHQAAARGTHASFFYPHIYEDHLFPTPHQNFLHSGVWLHKPVGPFWFGALMMHLVGVTPLALRLGSLFGMMLAAVALYLMLRRVAVSTVERMWAMGAPLFFLTLPFGWDLTQGNQFGDVTDTTLAGALTLAMALLFRASELDSWRWGAAAGAATGVAYLCKAPLALGPLGVVSVLFVLGLLGWCRGPRWRTVVALFGAAFAVAAPWNIYARRRWPEVAAWVSEINMKHVFGEVKPWVRPPDAIFNEINAFELAPLPVIVPLLAAVWLAVRAIRRREVVVVGLALWLWSTWIVLSVAKAKVPAVAWGAVPAVVAAMAFVLSDLWRRPALAGATLAALLTPALIELAPWLGRVREVLPAFFEQTRARPGLAEGIVLVALAAAAAHLLGKARWGKVSLAAAASIAAVFFLGARTAEAQRDLAEKRAPRSRISHTREVGLALDAAVPEKSVLFVRMDHDPPGLRTFAKLNLIFWSHRMAYQRPPDLEAARRRGLHPYLVSAVAEPFAPVEAVPAHAALRAYDLERPAAPPGLPEGAVPLDLRAGNLEVLGYAVGPVDADRARYAFFVRAPARAGTLEVRFVTRDGVQSQVLQPSNTLLRPARLVGAPWFILPAVGPAPEVLRALELGRERQRVPLPH